jgi:hypothetical protein
LECGGIAYRDLEVHDLLRKGAHFVVEAKSIFAGIVGGEDEITLSFAGPVKDDFFVGAYHRVVDVEGAAGLDL